jgi:hypothetical protein
MPKRDGMIVPVIDVFDVFTKKWEKPISLSEPREFLVAAATKGGEYVVFAGGNAPVCNLSFLGANYY